MGIVKFWRWFVQWARPVHCPAPLRCVTLGAVLMVIGLSSLPALAWDQNPVGVDMGPSECYSCTNNPPVSNNAGPSRREIRKREEDSARLERNARYEALYKQADAAWKRGDYREALRNFEQQQALRDGPIVRDAIVQAKAFLAWTESKTASEYRRAIAMRPGIFTADNIRYVEDLEAKEKYERERPQREAEAEQRRLKAEAEDLKAAAAIHDRLRRFAASLETPVSGDSEFKGGQSVSGAFGTNEAKPTLEFGDPSAMEAASAQMRQGFDNTERMAGAVVARGETAANATKDLVEGDPRMIAATQEIEKLQVERDQMDTDIARLTQERNVASNAQKMAALTAELDEKNKVKQEKLSQISKATEKTAKLRRTINTEVKAKGEQSK